MSASEPGSPAQTSPMPPGPAGRAVRLTYEYEADSVRLVAQQSVDVAVARPDSQFSPVARHIVEVTADDGGVLARVAVHTDLGVTTEVFGRPGEPIVRVPNHSPRGTFSVVVPAPHGAARAVLQRLDHHRSSRAQGLAREQSQADADTTSAVVLSDDAIGGEES